MYQITYLFQKIRTVVSDIIVIHIIETMSMACNIFKPIRLSQTLLNVKLRYNLLYFSKLIPQFKM